MNFPHDGRNDVFASRELVFTLLVLVLVVVIVSVSVDISNGDGNDDGDDVVAATFSLCSPSLGSISHRRWVLKIR